MFSQDHCAKVLLGWDTDTNHDAAYDAVKSVRLFNYYEQVNAARMHYFVLLFSVAVLRRRCRAANPPE